MSKLAGVRPVVDDGPSKETCDACAVGFSWLTLLVNTALGILKVVVGFIAGSKALIASALYSINDVLSGLVIIISMRVARRSPDERHAYGYGKAEFVAVGIVSVILAGAVVYIISHSVAILVGGVMSAPHFIVLPVTAVCAATNELLARRGFCSAKRTESPVTHTAAEHNRADAISSLAVMVGLAGATLGLHFLDPVIAIFEAVHIVWLAGALFGESLRGLMDAALSPEQEAAIVRASRAIPGVLEVELKTRQLGAYAWVDARVRVASDIEVERAHGICRAVERAITATLPQISLSQVKFVGGAGEAG